MKNLKLLLSIVLGFTMLNLNAQISTIQVCVGNGTTGEWESNDSLLLEYDNITQDISGVYIGSSSAISKIQDGDTLLRGTDTLIVDLYQRPGLVAASVLSDDSIKIEFDENLFGRFDSVILLRTTYEDTSWLSSDINIIGTFYDADAVYDINVNTSNTKYRYKVNVPQCILCNEISIDRNNIVLEITGDTLLSWNYHKDFTSVDTTVFNIVESLAGNNTSIGTVYVSNNFVNISSLDSLLINSLEQKIEWIISKNSGAQYYIEYNSNTVGKKSLGNYKSNSITVPDDTTSIVDIRDVVDFVMVNPATGLMIESSDVLDIVVYDMLGQEVARYVGDRVVDYGYIAGMYILDIRYDGNRYTEKLIVRN